MGTRAARDRRTITCLPPCPKGDAPRNGLAPVPLIVAYGMGVDSTAVLVGLAQMNVRPDLILFADTGGEKPETIEYAPTIAAYCRSVGFPTPVRVCYPGPGRGRFSDRPYASLEEQCLDQRMLPSLAYGRKGCSLKWKKDPQNKYVSGWRPARDTWDKGHRCIKVIGYDAGPADARRSTIADDDQYTYWYPLREWGWDRPKCKAVIAEAGLPVPLKSACFFCPAARPWEITWLVRKHPDLADRIIRMEAAAVYTGSTQGLWRRGTKCRGAKMTEWIRQVRRADAEGRGSEYVGKSEEGGEGEEPSMLCNVEAIDAVGDGCVAF